MDIPFVSIKSHNNIEALRTNPNCEFGRMKRDLIIGVRKTHKYEPNTKTSDYLVPYTSSGCSAMCLYCYLVCNYNKCSYLRLFVNREQMMDKLVKTAQGSSTPLTFEIGSNSDLVLENTITGNLDWTIEQFARRGKGFITLPTKFDMVDSLINLDHKGRTIIRMSVNPQEIIKKVEFGTSPLQKRIEALNKLKEAGYKIGILIAPVILVEGWQLHYKGLIEQLSASLSEEVKNEVFFEIIFMTYSYVHRMINKDAFPAAIDLYDPALMTVRGQGRYMYKSDLKKEGDAFFRQQLSAHFPQNTICYIV